MLNRKSSSTGMEVHIACFLAYLLGWISGLVLLLVERKSTQVRYHAAQSVVLFGALTILSILVPILPLIGSILQALLGVLSLGLWIVLMVTALMDNPPELPVVDEYARKLEAQVKPNGA